MPSDILVEKVDRVLVVALDREKQMNALSRKLIAELGEAIAVASTDRGISIVIISGSGSTFSAGADLKEALEFSKDQRLFRDAIIEWRDVFTSIEECPKPVIAGVNGIAIAGGLELALSCDLIVASSKAKLGDAHIKYGLVPGGGGSQRLPDAIGSRRARWLMYSGELLTADQAKDWGLVQEVFNSETFREDCLAFAEGLSKLSSPALAFMKRHTTSRCVSRDGLDLEIEAAVHVIFGADAQEGLRAFVDHRNPLFPSASDH